MKRLAIISSFTLPLILNSVALAAPEVLTLPFVDESVYVVQGWYYNEFVRLENHQGIDFKKGGSFQYEPFDVHAAYSGSLWCQDGDNDGYGKRCFIEHNVNSTFFYTVYAHLDSFVPNGPVVQGQKIGVAGKTGSKSNGVIHLHFEVQVNELCYNLDCRRDPYDIYATNVSYPKPPTNSAGLLGDNHWWATDPPTAPNTIPAETCNDGLQNQGETDIDCGGPCPPCNEPVCTNGDRRRCWIECVHADAPGCVYDGGPKLMGLETCTGGQWGLCETADGLTCEGPLGQPCANQSSLPAQYECLDGGIKSGHYSCYQQLGVDCMTSFYEGWPPKDCPEDLCTAGDDACVVQGETRSCDIHCGSANGQVVPGMQTCGLYCGVLAWSSCSANVVDACQNP